MPIHGKSYWNIFGLYESLKAGLKAAAATGQKIDAIGIDTWGVDFVYVGKDGTLYGLSPGLSLILTPIPFPKSILN